MLETLITTLPEQYQSAFLKIKEKLGVEPLIFEPREIEDEIIVYSEWYVEGVRTTVEVGSYYFIWNGYIYMLSHLTAFLTLDYQFPEA